MLARITWLRLAMLCRLAVFVWHKMFPRNGWTILPTVGCNGLTRVVINAWRLRLLSVVVLVLEASVSSRGFLERQGSRRFEVVICHGRLGIVFVAWHKRSWVSPISLVLVDYACHMRRGWWSTVLAGVRYHGR